MEDELRDLVVAEAEVETQDQRIGQTGFLVSDQWIGTFPGLDN
ncbi:hypothetical protein [Acidocella aminolytica]|nr:hypothetical protein [Acidocella aminolytica]